MKTTLIDLIEKKPFDTLTEEEKLFVLSQCSEADYRFQHDLVKAAQSSEKPEIKPAPFILPNAVAALPPKRKTLLVMITSYKVPAWVAVAACFLLFMVMRISFFAPTKPETTSPLVSQKTNQDTVIVEKRIVQTEIVHDTIVEFIYRDNQPIVKKMAPKPAQDDNYFSTQVLTANGMDYGSFIAEENQGYSVSLTNDTMAQLINRIIY